MSRPSIPTLRRIRKRQIPARFGADYEPSTKATREEAPSISRPSIITHSQFGRSIHCLSQPELNAAILALHYPRLVDLHEQKMLSPFPAPHPLTGLPGFQNSNLPFIRGTLDVAAKLNCRHLHPKVWVSDLETGERVPVAFPYQGDFLLFLEVDGIAYAINWTIKKESTDFDEPTLGSARSEKADRARRQRRFQIEDIYYSDVGIPTVAVSEDKMNVHVSRNLKAIYPYTRDTVQISRQQQAIVARAFQNALEDSVPANEVIARLAYDNICEVDTARTIFYQTIWSRQLRVNLFAPVLIDAPMEPESLDIFDYHKDWFPDLTTNRCRGI